MQAATEKIIEAGFTDKLLDEVDLARLFKGSAPRRYGLVNKALKHSELIRLSKGLYLLSEKYSTEKWSHLTFANHIVPYSYVSLESALAYYGWIPEQVKTVFSIIPSGHSRSFTNKYGEYSYERIPTRQYEFLTGVVSEIVGSQLCLIASPLRALADYVYLRKLENTGIYFFLESLRIDYADFANIQLEDIQQLQVVYRSERVIDFLKKLTEKLKK